MTFDITPELEKVFQGFVFEAIVAILWFLLLIAIIHNYVKKRSNLTKFLLLSFSFLLIGLIFSWLAKLIQLQYGYNTIEDFPVETPYLWLLARITQYRFSFAFITIGAYFTYKFESLVFDKEKKQKKDYFVIILSILTIFISLILYSPNFEFLDLITFFLAFIVFLLVYVPFMVQSFKLAYKMGRKEKIYRNAMISLGIMCICFLMIMFGMLFDRAMIIFIEGCDGYTFFYYLGWSSAIIGVFATFMGYIRPTFVQK